MSACLGVEEQGEDGKESRRSRHLLSLSSVCARRHLTSISHHVLLLRWNIAVRYASYLEENNWCRVDNKCSAVLCNKVPQSTIKQTEGGRCKVMVKSYLSYHAVCVDSLALHSHATRSSSHVHRLSLAI